MMRRYILKPLILLCLGPIAHGSLVINEFMAVNNSGLLDGDGQSSDWIELHNTGTNDVDLTGWHLSDDPTDPVKWTFPGVSLASSEYLIVYASNKFPTNINNGLHTNFRLDGDGEYLALIRADGFTIEDAYAPAYPRQVADTSFGVPSEIIFPTYLLTPTPGLANSVSTTIQSKKPDFSHTRGFYETPFLLSLTPDDPAETIRYTLDGSRPSASHGTIYNGPFQVAANANGGALTVRAVSARTGYADSDVRSHTYIFIHEVIQQPIQPPDFPSAWDAQQTDIEADYEMDPDIVNDPAYASEWTKALTCLPTLSISTEIGNLWDINGSRGIYDHGRDDGMGSERSISTEFIFPDQQGDDFQIDCGLRIQGGASRGNDAKHSLSLRFRNIYGDGELDFPLFPGSRVHEYDSIALRAEYNNSWTHWSSGQRNAGTLIRDDFARKAMIEMGNPSAGEGRFVHVYINGLYWGVYNLCERPNHSHYAAYNGIEDDSPIDARNGGSVINGSNTAWNEMKTFTGNWNMIQQRLNMNQYLDFTIIQGFARNSDLKTTGGNWRSAGGGPQRLPFELYPWDTERTLESVTANASTVTKAAEIFNDLYQLTEFRVRLADRIHAHLFNDGPLTPAANLDRWNHYTNQLYCAIIAESARWGDYKRDTTGETSLYARDTHWIPESERLVNNYFPTRTAEVMTDWITAEWYPDFAAPSFNQHGGSIPRGFDLTITPGAEGTLYYTVDGNDPRMEGGAIHPSSRSGPVSTKLMQTTTVRARMKDGNEWSASNESTFYTPATSLVVTEIMYNPPNPLHAFIELENAGDHKLVLEGLSFINGIRHTSGSGLRSLAPGEKILFVADQAAFEAKYGAGLLIAGAYEGTFDKGGEQLTLIDGQGNTVFSFAYNDSRGWPCTADGTGHSLVPRVTDDALLDFGGNWRASSYIGGSPGLDDPPPITDLLMNEVLAHTDFNDPQFPGYDSNDQVELFNTDTSPHDLADWYLSDDRNNLRKWAIPGTSQIASLDWLLFDEVHHFHNPTNIGFGLDKSGEEVLLSYLPDQGPQRVADCIRFKGEEKGVALGRFPDGASTWYHLNPTPGTANGGPTPSLVISEIMYHPAPTVGYPEDNSFHEFIELHNPTQQAIPLENGTGSWRIDGGVAYTFPPGHAIPAGGYLILVNFAPTNTIEKSAFMNHYALEPGTVLLGPYDGRLSNRGERIALEKPQAPDQPGDRPSWVIVDEVFYYDGPPYPADTDGQGLSLHRLEANGTGRPTNWMALPPLPAISANTFDLIQGSEGVVRWTAQAGITYILEYTDQLEAPEWIAIDTIRGAGPVQLIDPDTVNRAYRIYRVRAIP